ncbi:MAG: hypothetical protein CML66_11730 [Rhodobacteraceae bacterium]|nr:hypothetical protein [Paracoccaceae bacterium]MAY47423.1 hypothetical protein [Paracoccaceae bacterium]
MGHDIVEIAQLIQRWGLCRDQGRWDELAATFTHDGVISVTWFEGGIAGFIAASKRSFQPVGPRSKHLIGLPVVDVAGNRALAETNIQILGRGQDGDTIIDVTSHARFLDRLVRTPDGWRILRRDAVYEKDRYDRIGDGADPVARADLSDIPEPYRYLGHRLRSTGRPLRAGILCDGTPEAMDLLRANRGWLNG